MTKQKCYVEGIKSMGYVERRKCGQEPCPLGDEALAADILLPRALNRCLALYSRTLRKKERQNHLYFSFHLIRKTHA